MTKRETHVSKSAASLPGDEERRLFEREFAGVRPLAPGPSRVAPGRPAVAPARASYEASRQARPGHALAVQRDGNRVTGAAFGVSRETLRALARGEIRAEASCDLHGLRADAAAARLERFIEHAAQHGQRAVQVVCGRGLHSGLSGPVLLEVAVETLAASAARGRVLAFSSASPAQGGEGALLVLLRREH